MSQKKKEKAHDSGDGAKERRKPSGVEWMVGLAAGLMLAVALGFLSFEAIRDSDEPPMVMLRAEEVVQTPQGGYLVEILAGNRGGKTARALTIEGRLVGPGGEAAETSQVTLTWIPARAERRAGLIFRHDPRRYRLELEPKGFEYP